MNNSKYPILDRLIYERGIKRKTICSAIGVSPRTFTNKMSGVSEFSWSEVCKIQSKFFPDVSKEKLMQKNENKSA
jgi:hypothetical protein